MPANARPVTDERDGLLTFLAQQRLALKTAAHGLTDDQARLAPTASTLSIGGLVKHVPFTERSWIDVIMQRPSQASPEDYMNAFTLLEDETLAGALAHLDTVAAETEEIIGGISDMDQAVPVPKGVPWFPDDVEAWSVRWVLLHLIEEVGRHAGHADIIRESIDGAASMELLAAAENWPETPWVKPWRPAGATTP